MIELLLDGANARRAGRLGAVLEIGPDAATRQRFSRARAAASSRSSD
jgi:hypothetical protein